MNACDNQSRGNGVASPNTPRWPEADSEDDELEALQEEITRGASTRQVKRRMPVPGISANEEPKQPLDDNPHGGPRRCIRADEETKQRIDDNLHEPRTPDGNPHDAMSAGSTPRKRSRPDIPSTPIVKPGVPGDISSYTSIAPEPALTRPHACSDQCGARTHDCSGNRP